MMFKSVVLPHPDGPKRVSSRPGSSVKETSLSASTPPPSGSSYTMPSSSTTRGLSVLDSRATSTLEGSKCTSGRASVNHARAITSAATSSPI